jgi:hypothetical protein
MRVGEAERQKLVNQHAGRGPSAFPVEGWALDAGSDWVSMTT